MYMMNDRVVTTDGLSGTVTAAYSDGYCAIAGDGGGTLHAHKSDLSFEGEFPDVTDDGDVMDYDGMDTAYWAQFLPVERAA